MVLNPIITQDVCFLKLWMWIMSRGTIFVCEYEITLQGNRGWTLSWQAVVNKELKPCMAFVTQLDMERDCQNEPGFILLELIKKECQSCGKHRHTFCLGKIMILLANACIETQCCNAEQIKVNFLCILLPVNTDILMSLRFLQGKHHPD